MKPFEGVRILDATHVFAGPFCTYQMGWMGAEVVRVEAVQPLDFIRYMSPDEEQRAAGLADSFLLQNANKHSVALDLKNPKGQALFRKLAASADAVTENYRPGTMAKLGLDHEALSADRDDLIYLSLSGFGQSGPLRDIPAYDYLVQGVSSMINVQGLATGEPSRVGWPMIDYVAGLCAAFALSSALYGRSVNGKGQLIDVAMLDAALIIMGPVIGPWLTSQRLPSATGQIAASGSPFSGMFQTTDGVLVMTSNTVKQAHAVLKVIGREDLIDDPRIFPWAGRPEAGAYLRPILAEVLARRSADEWELLLGAASVPAGRLQDIAGVTSHPQVRQRGLIHDIDEVPGLGRGIEVLGPGFNFAAPETMVSNPTPPPLKGAHSRRYLREIGLSDPDIDTLIADGVTAEPN